MFYASLWRANSDTALGLSDHQAPFHEENGNPEVVITVVVSPHISFRLWTLSRTGQLLLLTFLTEVVPVI
jgi:hypothetical protein